MPALIAEIATRAAAGPVRVRVRVPHSPDAVAAVVWRYDATKAPVGTTPVGEFSPGIPEVPLGSVNSIRNNYFLIEGTVIHNNANPPTLYQVLVSILQGDTVVHEEIPPEGGSGEIGSADKPFVYRMHITEAP